MKPPLSNAPIHATAQGSTPSATDTSARVRTAATGRCE
jgi:hypothetical protein